MGRRERMTTYPIKARKPGYRYYSFIDETSAYDRKGWFSYGSDCYLRKFEIWIPVRLKKENIDDWICRHELDDIWIGAEKESEEEAPLEPDWTAVDEWLNGTEI